MLAGNWRQEIEEKVHQREQEVWLPAVTRKFNLRKIFRIKENSPSHADGREYKEKSKISQSEKNMLTILGQTLNKGVYHQLIRQSHFWWVSKSCENFGPLVKSAHCPPPEIIFVTSSACVKLLSLG